MTVDRFNWRPVMGGGTGGDAPAPRDGTAFVALTIITYVGGEHRPIDIVPELRLVHRTTFDALRNPDGSPPDAGYWRSGPPGGRGHSIGDADLAAGYWTTLVEYMAGIPAAEAHWRTAPSFVKGQICCPLVFIRPTQRLCDPDLAEELEGKYGPILAAEVVWPHGNTAAAPERWSSAKHRGLDGINPAYLDSGGWGASDLPCRWMMLSEFFPQAVFEYQIAEEQRMSAARIEAWRRRAAAPRPTPCDHLDWFFDGQLTGGPAGRLAQEFREHLPGCARCQTVLEGRMQEAVVVAGKGDA